MSVESIAAAVAAGRTPLVGEREDRTPPTPKEPWVFLPDPEVLALVTQLRIANLIAFANAAPIGSPRRGAALTEAEELLWGSE